MLVDSFAWMETFMGGERGAAFRDAMAEAPLLYTCPVVLAELTSFIERRHGAATAERYVGTVLDECAVVPHDARLGIEAGRIHAELRRSVPRVGMADAFVLAAARRRGVPVLTGDPRFAGIDDAILL